MALASLVLRLKCSVRRRSPLMRLLGARRSVARSSIRAGGSRDTCTASAHANVRRGVESLQAGPAANSPGLRAAVRRLASKRDKATHPSATGSTVGPVPYSRSHAAHRPGRLLPGRWRVNERVVRRSGQHSRAWFVREYAGGIGRLLLFLTIVAMTLAPFSASASTVGRGPPGVRFYTPPRSLPAGPHGALIRARRLTGPAVLSGAAVNELLL